MADMLFHVLLLTYAQMEMTRETLIQHNYDMTYQYSFAQHWLIP